MYKYNVSLNYYSFIFEDGNSALAFAEEAKKHYFDAEKNKVLEVSIEILKEEE